MLPEHINANILKPQTIENEKDPPNPDNQSSGKYPQETK
jgi:hypothetical protein